MPACPVLGRNRGRQTGNNWKNIYFLYQHPISQLSILLIISPNIPVFHYSFFFFSDFSVYVKWPIHFMQINGLKYYKIGELANLLGLSPRTIRYYEEIGLLNSVKRIEGGKRVYTDRDLQRLKFIQRLKHLGLTLSEMHELEDIYQIHRTNKKVLSRLLELLDGNTSKIDERINSLLKLKTDILSYEEKIRQKLHREDEAPEKGEELDKRSGDHECRSDSNR